MGKPMITIQGLDTIIRKKHSLNVIIVVILSLILFFIDIKYFLISVGFIITSVLVNLKLIKNEQNAIHEFTYNYLISTEEFNGKSVMNSPFPFVIVNTKGKMIWHNYFFKLEFKQKTIHQSSIFNILPNLKFDVVVSNLRGSTRADSLNEIKDSFFQTHIQHNEKWYKVVSNFVENYDNHIKKNDRNPKHNNHIRIKNKNRIVEKNIILYLIDETKYKFLKKEYQDSRNVVCLLNIDNYEEVLQNTKSENHVELISKFDKAILSWAVEANAIVKKYEKEKYLMLLEHKDYEIIENKKFDILESIRNINVGNKIDLTLSVGIGKGGTLCENNKFAESALDMALGRGGDQVVTKELKNFKFFGGSTKEVEKRTKVKVRVFSHALSALISQADNVFIMGHKNCDIDSFGASIALSKISAFFNVSSKIIIDSATPVVKKAIEKISESESNEITVNSKSALKLISNESLLIIVDTNRTSLVESKEILEKSKRTVIIDHHRKNEDYIDNTILSYHETFASSTCEITTEISQYIKPKFKLKSEEAELLYAGIVMDTKNFTFKTGVRTFQAAAYLKNIGVDTAKVKQMFQNDMEIILKKAEIINSVQIINSNIAVSFLKSCGQECQVIAAQAADDLLEIEGIEASFVLAESEHQVMISARSFGTINVQLILEQLGGGGHMTIAGAQIENKSLEESLKVLKEAIREQSNAT